MSAKKIVITVTDDEVVSDYPRIATEVPALSFPTRCSPVPTLRSCIIGGGSKRPFKNRDAVVVVNIRAAGHLTRLIVPREYENVQINSIDVDSEEQLAMNGAPATAFNADESGEYPDALASTVRPGSTVTIVMRRLSIPAGVRVPMRLVVRRGRFVTQRLDRYGVSRTAKPMIGLGMYVYGSRS